MAQLQVRIPEEKKELFSAAVERLGMESMSAFVIECVDALLIADRRGERVAIPVSLELERPKNPKR